MTNWEKPLNGYDIDGVLTAGVTPEEPYVIISGRTWYEWDSACRFDVPCAIRGQGEFGDREAAGKFKAAMIQAWNVRRFFEDDPVQVAIIKKRCPWCEVVAV